MKTLLDTLNIVLDVAPPTPFSNFVSGFIDIVSAGVDSYRAGQKIAGQASSAMLVAQSDILALRTIQEKLINRQYNLDLVRALVGVNIVREDWIFEVPVVTGVSPSAAILNREELFSVVGSNIPLTPTMTLGGIPCQIQSSPAPTASGFTAVCTPGGVVGNQTVSIMTNDGVVIDQGKSIAVTGLVNQYPEGTWYSVKNNILSVDNVAKIGVNIVNSQPFGGLFYKLKSPVDADNITFEVSAVFASMPGTYTGYDIAFAVNNMFGSGQMDGNKLPVPTKVLQANFRTNGWSDIVTAVTENGNQAIYVGTTDTRQWHLYKVSTTNGVISVYVDNLLKYTMPYVGSLGVSDAFTANGLSGIMIDPASLKIYPTR